MPAKSPRYVRVAVPVPLNQCFEYRWPAGLPLPAPGARVRVPFGRRERVGWLVDGADEARFPDAKIQSVTELIDRESRIPPALWRLIVWCWNYYHHPPGEVLANALPPFLRRAGPAPSPLPAAYALSETADLPNPAVLEARAPRQAELVAAMQSGAISAAEAAGFSSAALKRLLQLGWVNALTRRQFALARTGGPQLSDEQQAAVSAVRPALGEFGRFLLDGVTGSGKTEVYLSLIDTVLEQRAQALVLVPEIGLTPQITGRFRRRLGIEPVLAHSGLSDGERDQAWLQAASGDAPLIIGTRSAVFLPMYRPGLVILDEEHDLSFKQQDRLRYSARDVAVQRAKLDAAPVILGSATPSLESLQNARRQRYRHLRLTQRVGPGDLPDWRVVDMRQQAVEEGVSAPAAEAIGAALRRREQVLVFINRRGYAPLLMCHHCGWQADCLRCDVHMTLHRRPRCLRCHRCGRQQPVPQRCPACAGIDLRRIGEGTERIEQWLADRYSDYPVIRVDRDSTRGRDAMENLLAQIKQGTPSVLVGTQMLAKGHHFPKLGLAVILNTDQSLYSADFRASERLAQLLTQVAGRTGRANIRGEVLLQTYHPDHPFLQALIGQGYGPLAERLLQERREAGLPPLTFHCILRAEAGNQSAVSEFLAAARQVRPLPDGLLLYGPMPALQARRAGHVRWQLVLQAEKRHGLQGFLDDWLPAVERLPGARKVRWHVDVDPQEF